MSENAQALVPEPEIVPNPGMEDEEELDEGQMMTLLEHLWELKDRLIRIALAIFVWGIASFFLAEKVLEWLLAPMNKYEGQYKVIATRPTTTLALFMKISIFTGAVMAMPWIVHQVLIYVLPAMTRREKRALYWIIPGATFLFLSGSLFARYVMVPAAIPFLLGWWSHLVEQNWMIDEYVPFVTGMIFWVGVSFETPLIMAFVARMGVVTAKQFLGAWKFAVVAIAVLAAFITPTPDPFNMGLVMAPLVMLYFLGVLLSWIVQPKEKAAAQEAATAV
jgi:sec-independent protein translocase protein TatC